MQQKSYSSINNLVPIQNKINSVEITFMSKWRESKCRDLESFKEEHENWMHRTLEVRFKTLTLSKIILFHKRCSPKTFVEAILIGKTRF